MREIKIKLEDTIEKDLENLLKQKNHFGKIAPAFYFYDKILQYDFSEKFSDEFIKYSYLCLQAWGMDSQGAELVDFDIFEKSILDNKPSFESLEKSELKKLDNETSDKLYALFKSLQISTTDAKLVSFSKLVHFFLPNLVAPIDRKFTLNFFFPNNSKQSYFPNGKNQEQKIENQFDVFKRIHEIYRDFAKSHSLEQYISGEGWNRNVPKILDNAVIAFMVQNSPKT